MTGKTGQDKGGNMCPRHLAQDVSISSGIEHGNICSCNWHTSESLVESYPITAVQSARFWILDFNFFSVSGRAVCGVFFPLFPSISVTSPPIIRVKRALHSAA